MRETKKAPSPLAWVLGQTGKHGGQYILSVALAVMGVAFSLAPYFAVVGIVRGLMNGQKDLSWYLTRCLAMAVLWFLRVMFHAFSTAVSHKATFAVLGEIRGQVVQRGTHAELIRQDGIYRKFVSERREAAGWKVK